MAEARQSRHGRWVLRSIACLLLLTGDTAASQEASPLLRERLAELDYIPPSRLRAAIRDAVARGEIADPENGTAVVAPPAAPTRYRGMPVLTTDDIFAFEDTGSVLTSNFSDGQLIQLMVDAANATILTYGDGFDFVGFWVNSTPHHQIGAAFYAGIENDVLGIGDPSGEGTPLFNERDEIGLLGENVEGFVMMWNINSSGWQPGTASNADFTRLALAQEFEHRFALFLPNLLDGRSMQGNNGSCGRTFHWSWRVDGQGSGMEISEWVGSSPPVLESSFINFNTDIPGSVFSYSDLYLMGYVSPAEMDAGNSELRFMNGSSCTEGAAHVGPVTTFGSADIIASAGARVPDENDEDKDYRTAWVMIHQPGDPPTTFERTKAIQILAQHQIDWNESTLGRGTMDNSLPEIVAVPGAGDGRTIAWLGSPRPNPVRASATRVRYTLTEETSVVLAVHDVVGRRVATLVSQLQREGEHEAIWDGANASGERVAPGVYFVVLDAGRYRAAQRVTVID